MLSYEFSGFTFQKTKKSSCSCFSDLVAHGPEPAQRCTNESFADYNPQPQVNLLPKIVADVCL